MDHVITISREFGSGGREVGVCLAKRLEIPFYDKDIISMAADDSGLSEDVFRSYDENAPSFLEKTNFSPFFTFYEIPMSDQIFLAQSKVIRRLAEKGPCVIVGRCADMVLEDSINLFIYGKMKDKVKRMSPMEPKMTAEELESKIREIDRKRKDYYQYYTGNTWGKAQNYHLCLDSGRTGAEGCIESILSYLKYAK